MATDKAQIKAYIKQKEKEKFNFIAKQERRSSSNLLELLAINYIKKYEDENGEIVIAEDGTAKLEEKSKPKLVDSTNLKIG